MKRIVWAARAVLALLLSCGAGLAGVVHAQGQNAGPGTISGVVVDASGGAMPGAVVTLRTPAGERTMTTDATGGFRFDGVTAGATLTVSFDNFAPATLTVDAPRDGVRLVLEPLPLVERVTVRAPATTAIRTATATRTDTPLRDVPQAVTVITRDLITDQTMRSMADVANYVPGVGIAQGEGHRDAPIFRGNTSTSDFFVDGIRDDTQFLRDLYNVERVEVLKGPNGMVFGRGGVGGVINRVTRQADWMAPREFVVQGGSFGHRRLSGDVGEALSDTVAARVTGMYENSDTYRNHVGLERYGVNPTAAFALRPNTTLRAGYEFFRDERTVDRGIPSADGRPLDVDAATFFGSPSLNTARATVNAVSAGIEHRAGAVIVRNTIRYADYDKFYQNVVPGAVDAARTTVTLTGYNNATKRRNLFNQTDVIVTGRTGAVGHTMLAGVEIGRQETGNRRRTGYFPTVGATATSVRVPLAESATALPVEFRPSASDANNDGVATVAGLYVQDQIELTPRVQAILGLRVDRFDVELLDNRTATMFTSTDNLLSPRLGLVVKPVEPVSLYASYSRSYLPRAGEQLSSLSLSNQALDPEVFRNVEAGAKWEVTPAVSLTTALYRLVRGNVVVLDALDPTVSHLVDAQRTRGLELEVAGAVTDRWSVQGGYAWQDAEITQSLSAAVSAGARLAQVPRHSFSLWNKYDVTAMWAVGLGVLAQSDRFVSTDNSVVLPAFARVDLGVFARLTPQMRAHVNVENLFDERYFGSAHNNNNITPGSPRAVRVALMTTF